MIVEGLDTNRTYTADEVVAMKESGKLRAVTMRGWFLRWDMTKNGMRMVHFTDPTANRMTPGSTGGQRLRAYEVGDVDAMRAEVASDSPIRKRTPQERLASMSAKLAGPGEHVGELMVNLLNGKGDMDGLSDEEVKALTGASWKNGDPVTGDIVRRVAARYLGEAERKVAEQARETNTKAGRKARREQERLEAQERARWTRRRNG